MVKKKPGPSQTRRKRNHRMHQNGTGKPQTLAGLRLCSRRYNPMLAAKLFRQQLYLSNSRYSHRFAPNGRCSHFHSGNGIGKASRRKRPSFLQEILTWAKSTLFNALTGLHQHTGNWSGKTIELASGTHQYQNQTFRIIDLPGCYSLSPVSRDEQISYNYIMQEDIDAIVVVCDVTCLERNLLLALQLKSCLFTGHFGGQLHGRSAAQKKFR